ncbi:MAG TPA: hypothetical protein DEH02_09555 [Bacteroidales bacterium]|nr:hypothetical protein [Bacteroidales bacterium]
MLQDDDQKKEEFKIVQHSGDSCNRNEKNKVWQDGYHPEIIYSNHFFYQKLNYIHQNPVVEGLVENQEDYIYNSARNYAELDSVLDIIYESPKLICF